MKDVDKKDLDNSKRDKNVRVDSKYLLSLVSRSFALAIPMLEKNKRLLIETQYLLARILDTIEDSNHALTDKSDIMNAFVAMLKTGNMESLVNFQSLLIEKTILDSDKILISNSQLVLNNFFSFDTTVKKISIDCISEMAYGMSYYLKRSIETIADLDDYCYYVAGTVGVYLTRIVNLLDEQNLDLDLSKSFARFLQKVNIIKDAKKDKTEGRIFLPLELFGTNTFEDYFDNTEHKKAALDILSKLVSNAMAEFDDTLKYITQIDKRSAGYRNFAILASVMAYETLLLMENNYDVFIGKPIKINRIKTTEIVLKINSNYFTNERLLTLIEASKK